MVPKVTLQIWVERKWRHRGEDNNDDIEKEDNDAEDIEDDATEELENSDYHQETGSLETVGLPTSRQQYNLRIIVPVQDLKFGMNFLRKEGSNVTLLLLYVATYTVYQLGCDIHMHIGRIKVITTRLVLTLLYKLLTYVGD